MTPRMTPSIQRIQAAISQASLQSQTQGSTAAAVGQSGVSQSAARQSLMCSFEIEGRSQNGYLGVHSIAEVTPPWFPKDAFRLRSRRGKPASPMITLKRKQPKAADGNVEAGAKASTEPPRQEVQFDEAQSAVQSSVSGASFPPGSFQAVAEPVTPEPGKLTSAPVTAETLAELFEQAEPLSAPSELSERSEARQSSESEVEASAIPLLAELEAAQPHPSILTPVSVAEQAAAQTLAQTLSQASSGEVEVEFSAADTAQHGTDEAISEAHIKPIETVARPALPRSKSPEFSVHQNSTNPMLPLELLQNIGQEVIVWQEALKAVHQKIQSLYQEGPILNGWLEKPAHEQTYLLCRLDAAGQSWRSPCHPADLQQTSLAIGRYKRLRSLLGEKQRLDQRIKRLSETLTMLRLRLRAY